MYRSVKRGITPKDKEADEFVSHKINLSTDTEAIIRFHSMIYRILASSPIFQGISVPQATQHNTAASLESATRDDLHLHQHY